VRISQTNRILLALGAVVVWTAVVAQFGESEPEREAREAADRAAARAEAITEIEQDLAPDTAVESREGIAALVLMDVSGSMSDPVSSGGGPPKIEIARQSAAALIQQFALYASEHASETVLVGLYEFSERPRANAREVIPLSPPDPARAVEALKGMRPRGGTPIGDAVVEGKRVLDASGLSRKHLLVVTDGENTDGRDPAAVMAALAKRPPEERPSVYFVAFDIGAERFNDVRDAGGLVLTAGNERELNDTLGSLLSGKILVEER
jgi:hypothetical protein